MSYATFMQPVEPKPCIDFPESANLVFSPLMPSTLPAPLQNANTLSLEQIQYLSGACVEMGDQVVLPKEAFSQVFGAGNHLQELQPPLIQVSSEPPMAAAPSLLFVHPRLHTNHSNDFGGKI